MSLVEFVIKIPSVIHFVCLFLLSKLVDLNMSFLFYLIQNSFVCLSICLFVFNRLRLFVFFFSKKFHSDINHFWKKPNCVEFLIMGALANASSKKFSYKHLNFGLWHKYEKISKTSINILFFLALQRITPGRETVFQNEWNFILRFFTICLQPNVPSG